MSARWTPGPWFAVNDGTDDEPMMSVKAARIAGKPPRHEVALCATGDSPQEMENANANLIAAVPELFEALDTLLANSGARGTYRALKYADAVAAAEVALAKARGEAA